MNQLPKHIKYSLVLAILAFNIIPNISSILKLHDTYNFTEETFENMVESLQKAKINLDNFRDAIDELDSSYELLNEQNRKKIDRI